MCGQWGDTRFGHGALLGMRRRQGDLGGPHAPVAGFGVGHSPTATSTSGTGGAHGFPGAAKLGLLERSTGAL